jgi:phenol 2-monooxygenase
LSFDESKSDHLDAYPIEVTLRHLSEEDANPDPSMGQNGADDDTDRLLNGNQMNGKAGTTETVRAKYMIGCDGAHS